MLISHLHFLTTYFWLPPRPLFLSVCLLCRLTDFLIPSLISCYFILSLLSPALFFSPLLFSSTPFWFSPLSLPAEEQPELEVVRKRMMTMMMMMMMMMMMKGGVCVTFLGEKLSAVLPGNEQFTRDLPEEFRDQGDVVCVHHHAHTHTHTHTHKDIHIHTHTNT